MQRQIALYHTILNFNNPEHENIVGKRENTFPTMFSSISPQYLIF